MAFVEGETIPRRILRDDTLAGARAALAAQCGRVLAAIHRIPPHDVPGLPGGDPVEQLRAVVDRLGQPHPAFELAFRWLGDNRPPRSAQVVVHGDFRNGNLIVGPDGIRAVLDWELSHLGDPLEDLGWLCVKAWRFGSPLPVGGFGPVDQLVDAYAGASGAPVDRAALHWWEVLGTLRWGVICIVQTFTHLSGTVRSVELAAIGRRVCEVEWDLLELLGLTDGESAGRAGVVTDAGASASLAPALTLHDAPSAAELLEAVSDFLLSDVVPGTERTTALSCPGRRQRGGHGGPTARPRPRSGQRSRPTAGPARAGQPMPSWPRPSAPAPWTSAGRRSTTWWLPRWRPSWPWPIPATAGPLLQVKRAFGQMYPPAFAGPTHCSPRRHGLAQPTVAPVQVVVVPSLVEAAARPRWAHRVVVSLRR